MKPKTIPDPILEFIKGNTYTPPEFVPTKWKKLDDILGGGFPYGRLISISGASGIGKSSLVLNAFEEPMVYVDVDHKLNPEYPISEFVTPCHLNNDELFEFIETCIPKDVLICLDSLPSVGTQFREDSDRFFWLSSRLGKIQRMLIDTKSIVFIINQIRCAPATGKVYDAHEGCFVPAVKIRMEIAERRPEGKLVYVEVEKAFWGQDGQRCTLLIEKDKITDPSK